MHYFLMRRQRLLQASSNSCCVICSHQPSPSHIHRPLTSFTTCDRRSLVSFSGSPLRQVAPDARQRNSNCATPKFDSTSTAGRSLDSRWTYQRRTVFEDANQAVALQRGQESPRQRSKDGSTVKIRNISHSKKDEHPRHIRNNISNTAQSFRTIGSSHSKSTRAGQQRQQPQPRLVSNPFAASPSHQPSHKVAPPDFSQDGGKIPEEKQSEVSNTTGFGLGGWGASLDPVAVDQGQDSTYQLAYGTQALESLDSNDESGANQSKVETGNSPEKGTTHKPLDAQEHSVEDRASDSGAQWASEADLTNQSNYSISREELKAKEALRLRFQSQTLQEDHNLDLGGQRSSDRTADISYPPQPSVQQKSADSRNHFRAVPYSPIEWQQTQKDEIGDKDFSANWQHLRRKSDRTSTQEVFPPRPTQQSMDDSWIDRRFEEHQRRRQADIDQQERLRAQFSSPDQSRFIFGGDPSLNYNPSSSELEAQRNRRCARCGETGHIARNCPGRQIPKCYSCGEEGHIARDCPAPSISKQGRNAAVQSQTLSQRAKSDSEVLFGQPKSTDHDTRAPVKAWDPSEDLNLEDDSGRARRDTDHGGGKGRFAKTFSDSDGPETVHRRSREKASRFSKWTDDVDEDEDDQQSIRRARRYRSEENDEDDEDDRSYRRRSAKRSDEVDADDYVGSMRAAQNKLRAERRAKKEKARKERERRNARVARRLQGGKLVELPEFINISNLAQALNVRYESFVTRLARLGYDDLFPGKVLNPETSGLIAMEYNFDPVFPDTEMRQEEEEEEDLKAQPAIEDTTHLPTRPPVVTIMGHVDHGKTTILDYMRKSSVAAGEAGGITQHIGAFSVPLSASGKTITFLDTPGHAAFLAMRQRGANVTDIVILVVAADDSVKPQTLEAIKHAKAAGVPMIVAVNKIDKEEADIQRVKQDLARHNIDIEDQGGETQVIGVSGKTGEGMDQLEEAAVTLSDILDHRAAADGPVEGWIIEATTKTNGRVATVLVRRGTLRRGTIIVAGKTWTRVRSLKNEGGVSIEEVGPGMPVEVDGWREQPVAGDEVLQAPTEQKATSVVDYRLLKEERLRIASDMDAINETKKLELEKREREKAAKAAAEAAAKAAESSNRAPEPALPKEEDTESSKRQLEVPFIIKADVSGSAEALESYLMTLTSPLIMPTLLSVAIGQINESDIDLAATAQGHIISFNLPADEGMNARAEANGVKVLRNNIIYRVLDDVKEVLEARLPPLITQRVLGEAEIAANFDIGLGGRKTMKIAGCKVKNGVIGRNSKVRVFRNQRKVYDGTITSLKNVKKDVTEMRKGTECGMAFDEWEAFEVGDTLQTYDEKSEKRRL